MAKRNIVDIDLSAENPMFVGLDQYADDNTTLYIPNVKLKANAEHYENLKFVYERLTALTLGSELANLLPEDQRSAISFDEKGCETHAFKFKDGEINRGFTPSLYRYTDQESGTTFAVIRWGNQLFPLLTHDDLNNKIVLEDRRGEKVAFGEAMLGCWTDNALGMTFIKDDETAIRMWFRINLQWITPEDGGDAQPPTVSLNELEDDYFSNYLESFAPQLNEYRQGGGREDVYKLTEQPEDEEIVLIKSTYKEIKGRPTYILTIRLESGEEKLVWANKFFFNKFDKGLKVSEESPLRFTIKNRQLSNGNMTAKVRILSVQKGFSNVVTLD